MKKKLKLKAEFASMFHDPKWLVKIVINGFSSRRKEDNKKLYNKITKLIDEHNA